MGRETAENREDIARFLIRNPLTNGERTERVLLDALQREWRSGSIRALMQALLPLVTPMSPDADAVRQELKGEDERDRLKTVVQLWRAYVDGPAHASPAETDQVARQAWQANCEQHLVDAMNDRYQIELSPGRSRDRAGGDRHGLGPRSLLTKWRKESMTETVGWCVTEALAHLDNYAEIKDVQQAALDGASRKRRRPTQTDKPEPADERTPTWLSRVSPSARRHPTCIASDDGCGRSISWAI